MTDKRLFVGTHPDYQRRQDIVLQTGLVRPDIDVVHSVAALAAQIREWELQVLLPASLIIEGSERAGDVACTRQNISR
jgi:hypothetical protein